MNRRLLLFMLLLASFIPWLAAQEFVYDGLNYSLEWYTTDSNTGEGQYGACVSSNTDAKGDIVIPSHVEYEGTEYPVVRITYNAFQECKGITSISIPGTVKLIDGHAFNNCSNLQTVGLAEGLEVIEYNVFLGCASLKSIRIPSSVKNIGIMIFYGCSSLEELIIEDSDTVLETYCLIDPSFSSLKKIYVGRNFKSSETNENVFNCPQSLETLEFGDKVTEIPDNEFQSGNSLRTLVIPESIKRIGKGAFSESYGIQELALHEGIEEIGEGAFSNCSATVTINWSSLDRLNEGITGFPFTNPDGADGPYVNTSTPVVNLINGKPLKNVLLSMGMEQLRPYAFMNDKNVESVTFPDGLTSIGDGAFMGTSIRSVETPAELLTIGSSAFYGCQNLQEVVLNDGLESIGNGAFYGCIALPEIHMPNTVATLGANAFYGCTDLESVTLSRSLQTIEDGVFSGCVRLPEIVIPESVTSIGGNAFYTNYSLRKVTLGKGVKSLGEWAFYISHGDEWSIPEDFREMAKGKFEIELPDGLESIGGSCFSGRAGLAELKFPTSLQSIGGSAFSYTSIKDVVLHDAMTELAADAFRDSRVERVKLPAALVTIGNSAFENTCLTDIELPETLTTIGDRAFYGVRNLKCLTVPDAVTSLGSEVVSCDYYYDSNEGISYISLGKNVTSLSGKLTNSDHCFLEVRSTTPPALGTDRLGFTPILVLVPEGCEDAYKKNTRWKDYKISARNGKVANVHVNDPGNLAADIVLQTRLLPADVTNLAVTGTLNDDDFKVMRSNMTGCYSIDLSGITNTEIPAFALNDKPVLLNMVLPSRTTTIGESAFQGCPVLHIDALPETVQSIGRAAFRDCVSMDTDVVFSSALTTLGGEAFYNTGIRSVDMSAVESLQWQSGYYDDYGMYYGEGNTFASCRNLKTVTLPGCIDNIPAGTFQGSGLTSVEVPENVTTIGADAFNSCRFLYSAEFPSTLARIESNAFANSGLRAAELPASLEYLGEGAFNNSDIAYINFPKNLASIGSNVASDCDNLLVVNLPSGVTEIAGSALASPSLSAINSPSLAPAAVNSGNPFAGVDNYTCALSIPRQSFTQYLLAEYWGSFVGIRNCIEITLDVPADIEEEAATYIDENDYQEMLEDMQEEQPEEPEQPQQVTRRRAMRVLREAGIAGVARGYGKVFDNSNIYRDDSQQTRFFLHVDPSQDIEVIYDGKDITNTIDRETMSFVVGNLTKGTPLKIKAGTTGVGSVADGDSDIFANGAVTVYDLSGRAVCTAASDADIQALAPGVYIAAGRKIAVK